MSGQDDIDKKFDPHPIGSLGDLESLPGQFRQFASDVKLQFEILNERLMPMLTRLENALDDLIVRVTRVEKDQLADARERKALAERVSALEAKRTRALKGRKK